MATSPWPVMTMAGNCLPASVTLAASPTTYESASEVRIVNL
jgi:hypothetical protein